MTHYWLIWIFSDFYTSHHPAGRKLFVIVVAAIGVQLVLAWLVMKLYDSPVRRALSKALRPGR